jgi:DNA-binding PucR family transcriptional regulator
MISQLKKHYGSHFTSNRDTTSPEQYEWFQTEEGQWFGVQKEYLSTEEIKLLKNLFPLQSDSPLPKTKSEKLWNNLLFHNQVSSQFPLPDKLRFIHFIVHGLDEIESFTRTLSVLFSSRVTILWENKNQGILIEHEIIEETENIYHTAEALMSDFLIKISFYIGNIVSQPNHIQEVQSQFKQEQQFFKTAKAFRPKEIVHQHTEILPYALFQSLEKNKREQLVQHFLKSVLDDKELLQSIQVYLENNQNVSVAAKKIFIHRNSLQYRVDKFIERTGIDVRTFSGGLTVYLALLMHDSQK